MQDLDSIKRTIASAEDLGAVVATMKTMAAVNIRQYETAAEALHDYTATVESGLAMLQSTSSDPLLELESASGIAHTGSIVIGSDQGMCGQFNEQVVQFAVAAEKSGASNCQTIPLLCVGHRAADKLASMQISSAETLALPGSADGIPGMAQGLVSVIDRWRTNFSVRSIRLFHNRRERGASNEATETQLLPLPWERIRQRFEQQRGAADRSLATWTMDREALFSRYVHQWLFAKICRVLAESLAAENAARIAAMQSAQRNISDRLTELRSTFAQRRQTAITEELLDVVTGFEALRQSSRVPMTSEKSDHAGRLRTDG